MEREKVTRGWMRKDNFTMVGNEVLRRKDLSWKAKGIFVYLVSLPPDWVIYLDEVQRHSTDGRTSFRSGIQELKDKGYLVRKRTRKEDGTFEWKTILIEDPMPEVENQSVDNQSLENHSMDNQSLENETLLSTKELSTYKQITKELSTNISSEEEEDVKVDTVLIMKKWNELPESIPKIMTLGKNTKRYKSLKSRVEEFGEDNVLRAINNVSRSNFLQGDNNRKWTVDFDWFIRPNNFIKVLEGNYENKDKPSGNLLDEMVPQDVVEWFMNEEF